jgi:hypothetical protein
LCPLCSAQLSTARVEGGSYGAVEVLSGRRPRSLITVEYGGWALLSLAGVLAQSGGFFLHFGVGEAGRASVGTRLTRTGALLIAIALVFLVVGIVRA